MIWSIIYIYVLYQILLPWGFYYPSLLGQMTYLWDTPLVSWQFAMGHQHWNPSAFLAAGHQLGSTSVFSFGPGETRPCGSSSMKKQQLIFGGKISDRSQWFITTYQLEINQPDVTYFEDNIVTWNHLYIHGRISSPGPRPGFLFQQKLIARFSLRLSLN